MKSHILHLQEYIVGLTGPSVEVNLQITLTSLLGCWGQL